MIIHLLKVKIEEKSLSPTSSRTKFSLWQLARRPLRKIQQAQECVAVAARHRPPSHYFHSRSEAQQSVSRARSERFCGTLQNRATHKQNTAEHINKRARNVPLRRVFRRFLVVFFRDAQWPFVTCERRMICEKIRATTGYELRALGWGWRGDRHAGWWVLTNFGDILTKHSKNQDNLLMYTQSKKQSRQLCLFSLLTTLLSTLL